MNIRNIDAIFFDFDGVMTDNRVFINQEGTESVCCNRGDGLAVDTLRKLKIPVVIFSSEKNKVVAYRAAKLNVPAITGISNKQETFLKYCKEHGFNLKKVLFVGNDLNDIGVMRVSEYSACPADSHPKIREVSTFNLTTRGGDGVAREIVEVIFGIDIEKILFGVEL